MISGKCPLLHEPTFHLGENKLTNVDELEILGNVFNCQGTSSAHTDNRAKKCRQSFYGLGNSGMLYPGASPEVQAYLYKSVCQPTLTYGLECMSRSSVNMKSLECIQGKLLNKVLA